MQFLDAIGLAYFWEKIKDWANSRFLAKEVAKLCLKEVCNIRLTENT